MAAEPAAKKQKTEEGAVPKESATVAVVAENVEVAEREADAPPDNRPKLKERVHFDASDSTPNVMEARHGPLLMPLTTGGFQYLLAGVRSNVGASAGRYVYEVKIIEFVAVPLDSAVESKAPAPRNLLRLGFATATAPLLLNSAEDCYFDNEGFFVHNGRKTKAGQPFGRGDVVAVVLNLNNEVVNANTVSLYKNGVLIGKPQPLPENLKGKALFPVVNFRQITLQYNFGPEPLAPLPFRCRMLQEASTPDVSVKPAAKAPKDGKYDVLFPVALPGEGGFDWLDGFLQDNPSYFEISERSLGSWCEQSGVKSLRYSPESRNANDNPLLLTGLPMIEDMSVLKALKLLAPLMQRNFVVMSLKANLIKAQRMLQLEGWPSSFKRVAVVAMGEPSEQIKKATKEYLLKSKQAKLDREFEVQRAATLRKREAEKKLKAIKRSQKLIAKKKAADLKQKKLEEEQKKKASEAAAAAAAVAKEAAEAGTAGEDESKAATEPEKSNEPAPEDVAKEAVAEGEEDKDSDQEDDVVEETMDLEPPKAELDDDEKQMWFRKPPPVDMARDVIDKIFINFSVPEALEGFDEVRFVWAKDVEAKARMKEFVTSRKLLAKIEDLQPGPRFTDRTMKFAKAKSTWQTKTGYYTTQQKTKAAAKAGRLQAKEQKKKAKEALMEKAKAEKAAAAAAAEKKEEEAKAHEGEEKEEAQVEEGTTLESTKKKEAQAEEQKQEGAAPMEVEKPESEEEPEEPEVPATDFESLDVFGVKDVNDIGAGQPLFTSFSYEDWAMLSLRGEVHNLLHAFQNDVKDEERKFMHLDNFSYYYTKYYRKQVDFKSFGCESVLEMLRLIPDTVIVREPKMTVESVLPDLESFQLLAMITEESRRDRQRRVDLGDESAKFKFTQPGAQFSGQSLLARTTGIAAASTGLAARPALPSLPMTARPAASATPSGLKILTSLRPLNFLKNAQTVGGARPAANASSATTAGSPRPVGLVTLRPIAAVPAVGKAGGVTLRPVGAVAGTGLRPMISISTPRPAGSALSAWASLASKTWAQTAKAKAAAQTSGAAAQTTAVRPLGIRPVSIQLWKK